MKNKTLMLIITIVLLLLLSSCAANNKDDTENEYTFTEIDTGMPFQISMYHNYSNSIYVLGYDLPNLRSQKQIMSVVSISDLTSSIVDFSSVIDDGNFIIRVYPHPAGGYWIFEIDEFANILLIKHCSPDFEVIERIDLTNYVEKEYSRVIDSERYDCYLGGFTSSGEVVIGTSYTVFTLNSTGEYIRSWDKPEFSDDLHISRLIISNDDLYYFTSNTEKVVISAFGEDGTVKELFNINAMYYSDDSLFSDFVVSDDGKLYLVEDRQRVYSISEDASLELVFDWSTIKPLSTLSQIIALPNNEFVVKMNGGLFFVSKNAEILSMSLVGDKTEIVLACYAMSGDPYLRQLVNNFNNNSAEYEIKVIDYAQYADGIMKLYTETITGSAPDIFYWGLSMNNELDPQVFSSGGYLLDLRQLMRNENESFTVLPNLLDALEYDNGEIYVCPLEFFLFVVAGSVEVVGYDMGWTLDDFFSLMEDYPDAKYPFGGSDWKQLIRLIISYNYDLFVDWSKGECYFDSNEFLGILKMIEAYSSSVNLRLLPIKLVERGDQLVSFNTMSDVSSIQKYSALFGTDVNFIGFPTTQGIGNSFVLSQSISISSTTQYSDVCIGILRDLLLYDNQIMHSQFFPVNYEALQERLNNPTAYEEPGATISYVDFEGERWSIVFEDATPEESEQVRQLIESCDRVYREDNTIMTIVETEVAALISGNKSAEEVAKIIQSRVQIYVSEQS
jgi:hypothetical protein